MAVYQRSHRLLVPRRDAVETRGGGCNKWLFKKAYLSPIDIDLREKVSLNDSYLLIHFQWIPSHANIAGNEIADSLSRAGAGETTTPAAPFIYLKLFSKNNAKTKAIWMNPPVQPWYQSKCPGDFLVWGSSRRDQTALTSFFNDHLMSLTFVVMALNTSKFALSFLLLPWSHFILFGAYKAGLRSRSLIGFRLLQGE
ncbi:RNase H domain-containing protein [Trichonephila clavipes]|nr:RNase H domain-containing protein [Trichonephila clavipes]